MVALARVRVGRSLDKGYGLDEECGKALKRWQFTPSQKDGVAVPVIVEGAMTFSIGKPR